MELTETAGQSAIYVSTEIVNPSPVNSPAVTYRNEEPASIGTTKTLIVPTNQRKVWKCLKVNQELKPPIP